MVKRIALFSVVLFSVISLAALSWAAVTSSPTVTGSWNVAGTVKEKVSFKVPSVKKGVSGSTTGSFADYLIFDPDGSFHMTDMDGTWSQSKNSFCVHLDPLDIAAYAETFIEDLFWSLGYNVAVSNVSVTKNNFCGKINKTGAAISGKWDLSYAVSIDFYDFGVVVTAKTTVTESFAGTVALFVSALGDSQAVESDQPADGMDALLYPLVDSIMRSVVAPNTDLPQ